MDDESGGESTEEKNGSRWNRCVGTREIGMRLMKRSRELEKSAEMTCG